jgi:hypothetical protein
MVIFRRFLSPDFKWLLQPFCFYHSKTAQKVRFLNGRPSFYHLKTGPDLFWLLA